MDNLIDYDKILNTNFKFNTYDKIPEQCPNCKKYWTPEPPPLRIMQESFFGAKRMAQKYYKTCEFCGCRYEYWG